MVLMVLGMEGHTLPWPTPPPAPPLRMEVATTAMHPHSSWRYRGHQLTAPYPSPPVLAYPYGHPQTTTLWMSTSSGPGMVDPLYMDTQDGEYHHPSGYQDKGMASHGEGGLHQPLGCSPWDTPSLVWSTEWGVAGYPTHSLRRA